MIDVWAGLTDVLLVAACVWGMYAVRGRHPIVGFGLALIGVAAALGVVEFLVAPSAKAAHDAATGLAGTVGVPLVGLGAVAAALPAVRRAQLPLAIALVIVGTAMRESQGYAESVGGLGLVLAAVAGATWLRTDRTKGALVIAGAVGAIVAGLGVSGPGDWLGLSRLGWFHVAFAASVALLAAGLRRT